MTHFIVVFAASFIAILLEYVTRKHFFPTWIEGFYIFIPFSILLSFLLYTAFSNRDETYLGVWILFYTLNMFMRTTCSCTLLGEPLTANTVIGLILVTLGAFLVKQ